jgi:hypothetical protein
MSCKGFKSAAVLESHLRGYGTKNQKVLRISIPVRPLFAIANLPSFVVESPAVSHMETVLKEPAPGLGGVCRR